jgi:hypothetical protein
MERKNIIGIDTNFGYRTIELYEGNLCKLDRSVDVLVVSTFAGNYDPTPGTVVGGMWDELGLDVSAYRRDADFDLTSALGVWISRSLTGYPFSRLLCAEFLGTPLAITDVIENVFVSLSILEAKGGVVAKVALPALGTGSQGLDPRQIIKPLLCAAEAFFRRSIGAHSILLVDNNPNRVAELDLALDEVLGRAKVFLPLSKLLDSLRQDVKSKLLQAADLFLPTHLDLRDDWLRLLSADRIRSFELGVLSRRLIELLVAEMGASGKDSLSKQIDALQAAHVAPWIRGYMHVLRHVGNESAHEGSQEARLPPSVEPVDLGLCLACVNRLLEFWIDHRRPFARESVASKAVAPGGQA